MANIKDWTDEDIHDYLNELDEADVELSDWDIEFIASNMNRHHFSPAQREIVQKYAKKFGDDFSVNNRPKE